MTSSANLSIDSSKQNEQKHCMQSILWHKRLICSVTYHGCENPQFRYQAALHLCSVCSKFILPDSALCKCFKKFCIIKCGNQFVSKTNVNINLNTSFTYELYEMSFIDFQAESIDFETVIQGSKFNIHALFNIFDIRTVNYYILPSANNNGLNFSLTFFNTSFI